MAQFEIECKQRACIRCKKKGTLIPRKPSNYQQMRCTNCGCLLTIIKED
jgi:DNA-directed RNA polymerase subunit RPC12/RpoP